MQVCNISWLYPPLHYPPPLFSNNSLLSIFMPPFHSFFLFGPHKLGTHYPCLNLAYFTTVLVSSSISFYKWHSFVLLYGWLIFQLVYISHSSVDVHLSCCKLCQNKHSNLVFLFMLNFPPSGIYMSDMAELHDSSQFAVCQGPALLISAVVVLISIPTSGAEGAFFCISSPLLFYFIFCLPDDSHSEHS